MSCPLLVLCQNYYCVLFFPSQCEAKQKDVHFQNRLHYLGLCTILLLYPMLHTSVHELLYYSTSDTTHFGLVQTIELLAYRVSNEQENIFMDWTVQQTNLILNTTGLDIQLVIKAAVFVIKEVRKYTLYYIVKWIVRWTQ